MKQDKNRYELEMEPKVSKYHEWMPSWSADFGEYFIKIPLFAIKNCPIFVLKVVFDRIDGLSFSSLPGGVTTESYNQFREARWPGMHRWVRYAVADYVPGIIYESVRRVYRAMMYSRIPNKERPSEDIRSEMDAVYKEAHSFIVQEEQKWPCRE
ncbi:hypothetical protein [Salinibacter ruber]|uniref:hypothetical protein n=1 Tax=Salinibacter ruber TaxID=146919 RepID=UPI0021694B0F|nr:hypothetical protein [Salinibacter ruber]